MRPTVGLMPASMFWLDGLRIDPDVSVPTLAAHRLAAVPTARARTARLQRRPPIERALARIAPRVVRVEAEPANRVVVGRHRRRLAGHPVRQFGHAGLGDDDGAGLAQVPARASPHRAARTGRTRGRLRSSACSWSGCCPSARRECRAADLSRAPTPARDRSRSASSSAPALTASAACSVGSYIPIRARYCRTSSRDVTRPSFMAACISAMLASTTEKPRPFRRRPPGTGSAQQPRQERTTTADGN